MFRHYLRAIKGTEEGCKASNSSATNCHYNISLKFIGLLSCNRDIANKFCSINKSYITRNQCYLFFLLASKNIHEVKYLSPIFKLLNIKLTTKYIEH